MTAPARRPLPDAQLDALLRGVLGAPKLSAAQRQRHLRRLLPAEPPSRRTNGAPARGETDAARIRSVPAPAGVAAPRRSGRLRQCLGFVASLVALALVAGLLMAVFGAGDRQRQVAPASPAPAPNNVYVVTTSGVSAIDAATGRTIYTLPAPFSPDAALSPDGTRLYVTDLGDGGTLSAHDAATGNELWRVPLQDRVTWMDGWGPSSLAVAPDGQRLYIYSCDCDGSDGSYGTAERVPYWTRIFDAQTGQQIGETTRAPGNCAPRLHASQDGQTLYGVCERFSGIGVIDVASAEQVTSLSTVGPAMGSVASRDGRTLYLAAGLPTLPRPADGLQISVIDMNARALVRQVTMFSGPQPTDREALALSPDGARLFVGISATGQVDDGGRPRADAIAVLDTATLREVGRIPSERLITGQSLAASADGRAVYAVVGVPGMPQEALGNEVMRYDIATGAADSFTVQGSDVVRVLVTAGAAGPSPAAAAPRPAR